MTEPNRNISPERKAMHYVGMILIVLEVLIFGFVFLSAALSFGDFTDFAATGGSKMMRAVVGVALTGLR
ncbi:MAG: hypothetical protein WBD40_19160 [Tepidisphaeraceae bacterium]